MEFRAKQINERDDSLLDGLAELSLSNLLHLGEDHGRDFLGREGLLFAKVVDLDKWRAVPVNDSKWPVGHVLRG